MSTASVRDRAKERAGAITVLLTIVGYGAVGGVFLVPQFQALFPELTRSTVDLLAHAIAAVNSVTIVTLTLGWYWIRNGEVDKQPSRRGSAGSRRSMLRDATPTSQRIR